MRYRSRAFVGSIIAIAIMGLSAGGCAPKRAISADAINQNMNQVLVRHQQYVKDDPRLPDIERRTYLRTGRNLQDLLDTAMEQPRTSLPGD